MINRNMRCIEIFDDDGNWVNDEEINRNMRCIEIEIFPHPCHIEKSDKP